MILLKEDDAELPATTFFVLNKKISQTVMSPLFTVLSRYFVAKTRWASLLKGWQWEVRDLLLCVSQFFGTLKKNQRRQQ